MNHIIHDAKNNASTGTEVMLIGGADGHYEI